MALKPFDNAVVTAGIRAFAVESAFKPAAEAAQERFRARKADLEQQVKDGTLGPKVFREKVAEAAAELRKDLAHRLDELAEAPDPFADPITKALALRERPYQSTEDLIRETNGLLRQSLVETEIR